MNELRSKLNPGLSIYQAARKITKWKINISMSSARSESTRHIEIQIIYM